MIQIEFKFVPIDEINNRLENDFIDVIGIITEITPAKQLPNKFSNKKISSIKRIVLSDDTNTAVSCTLWNTLVK